MTRINVSAKDVMRNNGEFDDGFRSSFRIVIRTKVLESAFASEISTGSGSFIFLVGVLSLMGLGIFAMVAGTGDAVSSGILLEVIGVGAGVFQAVMMCYDLLLKKAMPFPPPAPSNGPVNDSSQGENIQR